MKFASQGNVATNGISFSVAQSSDKLTVTVTNFGNFGASFTMTGTVSGNTITLDTPQSVTISGDTYTVKAPATITLGANNAVTIAYNFDYNDGTGAVNFQCTASGTKQ
ncbi:MAG: hypothetical protein M0D57_20060 [Sphingobacteriales bacterium JAD_PAG50586_3]|nr:MAG: hypothetical protein M0D57_20060 [Sphingobacteriales bacterium JAD_PAG50586_3]